MANRTRPFHPASQIIAVLSAAWLAGCVPDLGPKPELENPETLKSEQTLAAPAGDWPADQWWERYGDSELDTLIDEALAGSPDLKIAEARMHQADAAEQQAG